jgi:hypothetical protein
MAAGWRTLQPVSVPRAAIHKSFATATADHQLDPQGILFVQYGFRHGQ